MFSFFFFFFNLKKKRKKKATVNKIFFLFAFLANINKDSFEEEKGFY